MGGPRLLVGACPDLPRESGAPRVVRPVLEPWESLQIEVEEFTEAADDRVFLGGSSPTRGKGSGAETQLRGWFVVWIANGKITRRQVFLDRDEALGAAGLRE
jgi:ketosteroid isomerase-like protein